MPACQPRPMAGVLQGKTLTCVPACRPQAYPDPEDREEGGFLAVDLRLLEVFEGGFWLNSDCHFYTKMGLSIEWT